MLIVSFVFLNTYETGYLIIENNSGAVLKDVEINYTNNQTSIKIKKLETNKKYKFKIVADSDDSIDISYDDNSVRKSIIQIYVFKGVENQYVDIISENGKIKVKE